MKIRVCLTAQRCVDERTLWMLLSTRIVPLLCVCLTIHASNYHCYTFWALFDVKCPTSVMVKELSKCTGVQSS